MKRYENGREVFNYRNVNFTVVDDDAESKALESQRREECYAYVVDDHRKRPQNPSVKGSKSTIRMFHPRPSLDWIQAESDAV